MTAEPDLLPLYAELQGHPKLEIIKHYARANVEHHTAPLQAEIQALRAEVERWKAHYDDMSRRAVEALDRKEDAQIRAERLAEAGRRVTAAFRALGETTAWTRAAEQARYECEAAMLALDAALEQEAGRG